MTKPYAVRVTLEVERGSDPVRGVLWEDEEPHVFAGWLGLAIELERVLSADARPQPDGPSADQ